MAEGHNASTGVAWGCTSSAGWVPYPKEIPRRHPLLDVVGRVDDPCDRPLKAIPNYEPVPKYKPPREGYPNNMCRLEDYQQEKDEQEADGAYAIIDLARGTPKNISFRINPIATTETVYANAPSPAECCSGTRKLDVLREKYEQEVGPRQVLDAKCAQSCSPLLPPYPCIGILEGYPKPYVPLAEDKKCLPPSLREPIPDGERNQDALTGWEGIEGKRTCDHYPIEENLPCRFNNPDWFKGYGSDRPTHPFYVTTGEDYGRFGPTPHTMTQRYYPRNCGFTNLLGRTGMYRNRTLNTNAHKTKV